LQAILVYSLTENKNRKMNGFARCVGTVPFSIGSGLFRRSGDSQAREKPVVVLM